MIPLGIGREVLKEVLSATIIAVTAGLVNLGIRRLEKRMDKKKEEDEKKRKFAASITNMSNQPVRNVTVKRG